MQLLWKNILEKEPKKNQIKSEKNPNPEPGSEPQKKPCLLPDPVTTLNSHLGKTFTFPNTFQPKKNLSFLFLFFLNIQIDW